MNCFFNKDLILNLTNLKKVKIKITLQVKGIFMEKFCYEKNNIYVIYQVSK